MNDAPHLPPWTWSGGELPLVIRAKAAVVLYLIAGRQGVDAMDLPMQLAISSCTMEEIQAELDDLSRDGWYGNCGAGETVARRGLARFLVDYSNGHYDKDKELKQLVKAISVPFATDFLLHGVDKFSPEAPLLPALTELQQVLEAALASASAGRVDSESAHMVDNLAVALRRNPDSLLRSIRTEVTLRLDALSALSASL